MWSNSFRRFWSSSWANIGAAFRARLHTMSAASSSSSFSFSRWLDGYCRLLETHPFATQITTSSALGFAGDFTTQWFEHRWEEAERIKRVKDKTAKGEPLTEDDLTETPRIWNFRRAFSCGLFGTVFMGPIGHVWYNWLDKVCYRLFPLALTAGAIGREKWKMIFFKSAADTLTFGPITLMCFFAFVSALEGVPSQEIKAKLKRDFVPTYVIDYSIWPIVQCINFRFIPLRHQLLFVNLNCYFDDIFLSFIQHNGMPSIFKGLEERYEKWVDLSPEELRLAERAARRARGKKVDDEKQAALMESAPLRTHASSSPGLPLLSIPVAHAQTRNSDADSASALTVNVLSESRRRATAQVYTSASPVPAAGSGAKSE